MQPNHTPAAPPADHSTLPVMLTPFVGRQREVAELLQHLAAARCVSLVGAGGCGKTRLAHTVAHALESHLADGVCWVELAAIQDPAFVTQAVTRRLNPDG